MSSSATLTETVVPAPDFTMSAATPAPINPGQQATSVVTITAVAGFTGAVTLTCAVNPTYLTDTPGCSMKPKPSDFECDSYQRDRDAHHDDDRSFAVDAVSIRTSRGQVAPVRTRTIAAIFATLAMLLILAAVPRHHRKSGRDASGVRANWRFLAVGALGFWAASRTMHGCGEEGGGGGTDLTNLGTQPFTYTVAVTGDRQRDYEGYVCDCCGAMIAVAPPRNWNLCTDDRGCDSLEIQTGHSAL